jgi:hypothetical protein
MSWTKLSTVQEMPTIASSQRLTPYRSDRSTDFTKPILAHVAEG